MGPVVGRMCLTMRARWRTNQESTRDIGGLLLVCAVPGRTAGEAPLKGNRGMVKTNNGANLRVKRTHDRLLATPDAESVICEEMT